MRARGARLGGACLGALVPAPLGKAGRLPSQPTLSRRVAGWSAKEGVEVLREGLQRLAGWRLKAMGGWRRPETLVIDIDSLPVEVHGEQPGSAWNGYYHRRVYHPIVAAAGETGDILDLRLREGQVHTADGGLEFVLEVLERAERHLCGKAAVRFDAGYPGEPLMAALEERGTHYVARVRNSAVLKRLSLPAMDAVVWDALRNGAPAGEPRTWVCESSCRAGSWSRSRRVVQVVVERPGELIPRCFWLLTSIPTGEMSGEDLLALYRKRGKAEGHLGELMSVVAPALSSTSRRKSHYRGKEIRKREKGVDAFACNQVPAARTAPRCLQVPETGHLRRVNCVFRTRNPGRTAPQTPFGGPSTLPEPRQPPKLPFDA